LSAPNPGERYKSISKETQGILKGEYGAAPSAFNTELQNKVLDGKEPITCRPADLLEPEMDSLLAELKVRAKDKGFALANDVIDDALTMALFPQIGLKFLENRGDADAFEPAPTAVVETKSDDNASQSGSYSITINGKNYVTEVYDSGEVQVKIADKTYMANISADGSAPAPSASSAAPTGNSGETIVAPLAGNIFKLLVKPGDSVAEGDTLLILEAMKMETEVKAPRAMNIASIDVKEGDSVAVGDTLLTV